MWSANIYYCRFVISTIYRPELLNVLRISYFILYYLKVLRLTKIKVQMANDTTASINNNVSISVVFNYLLLTLLLTDL